MHELSLAEDMLGIIKSTLKKTRPITRVTVVLGPLSGVSPESLAFCFTETAKLRGFGSPELEIRTTRAGMKCTDCGNEWESADFTPGCPQCGSWNREILSGREFYMESIELEDADEDQNTGDAEE